MKTTNVGRNEKNVTTNMIVTYPGKDGIEISTKGQVLEVKKYLEEVGNVRVGTLNNSEKQLRAYLAKYYPEKLKEYYKREADIRAKENKDDEGIEI